MELDLAGITPTPRAFEVWHVHLSGASPELSRHVEALRRHSGSLSPAAIDDVYARHIAPEHDEHSASEGAEALRQEAQGIVEDIAASGAELQRYGDALSSYSNRLREDRSVESLAQAVAMLTAEMARASERNRALEQQLSAATARVARLRDSLSNIKHEAKTDGLTGLCNRKAFDVRLRRAVTAGKADGVPVSVLMIDVDHFKRVNDTHGHHVGDLVLPLIGRLLSENVKGRDTAARYGGEEFGIILAGASRRAAATVAEQIRAALASKSLGTKMPGEGRTSVTVLVGVAEFRPGDMAASLIARADEALYRAKRAGRNRVCADEDGVGSESALIPSSA